MRVNLIINTLRKNSGGVPKAIIKRANMLQNQKDVDVTIFVLNYQKKFDQILANFHANGEINKNVKVVNVIDSYYKSTINDKLKKGYRKIKILKGFNKYEKKNVVKNNILEFSNFFHKNKLKARVEYNEKGDIRAISYYKNGNKNNYDYIILKNNAMILKIKVYDEKWSSIKILKDNKTFENPQDFYAYSLNILIDNEYENFIFSEFRDVTLKNLPGGKLDLLINNLDNRIKKICYIHTEHERLLKIEPKLFEYKNFEKYIVLTKEQKDDIKKIYPNIDIDVISNIVPLPRVQLERTNKLNRMLFLGRYEKVKNIDEMIKIFKVVKKEIPAFEFNLYGHGSEYQRLLDEYGDINGININKSVGQKEIDLVFSNNSFVISTSFLEGQQMVLLEAFARRIPIFTYPFKYGPSDIIIQYDNGIITKERSIEEMSSYIIRYIKSDYTFKQNSKYEAMYNEEYIKNKYKKLLKF